MQRKPITFAKQDGVYGRYIECTGLLLHQNRLRETDQKHTYRSLFCLVCLLAQGHYQVGYQYLVDETLISSDQLVALQLQRESSEVSTSRGLFKKQKRPH